MSFRPTSKIGVRSCNIANMIYPNGHGKTPQIRIGRRVISCDVAGECAERDIP